MYLLDDQNFPTPELIEAQKTGNLLFFCGAGVSIPAGLPSFTGLVSELAHEITGTDITIKEFNSEKPELQLLHSLFVQGELDRAVSILEAYNNGNNLDKRRKEIISWLQGRFYNHRLKPGSLERHKKILKLAVNNKKIRIVTTNFDDFFERGLPDLRRKEKILFNKIDCNIYNAPLIPPPRPDRWSGIIKIHGNLGDPQKNKYSKENNDEIILSSGDFGRAYLTERWASRFITDLFNNFHVLFIGYSLKDPVLRYIIDAYSLDAYHNKSLKSAHILLDKNETSHKHLYGTKINIHTYDPVDKLHSGLDKLLDIWIEKGTGGPIQTHARITRLSKEKLRSELEISDVVSELKHSVEAVKYFCGNEKEGLADISWLKRLDDAGLLVAYKGPPPEKLVYDHSQDKEDFVIPLVGTKWQYARTRVDEKAIYLSQWLAGHIDKIEVIDWMLQKGGVAHPKLQNAIEHKLFILLNNDQDTDFRQIFDILFNKNLIGEASNSILERQNLRKDLENESGALEKAIKYKIIEFYTPHLKIKGTTLSKAIRYRESLYTDNKEITYKDKICYCLSEIFDLELPEKYEQDEIKKILSKSDQRLADIAPDAYILLKQAFDILKLLKEHVYTYISRPSIASHAENKGFVEWDVLLDLTRDSMIALLKVNHKKAVLLLQTMLEESTNDGDPDDNDQTAIFTRLALHLLIQPECKLSSKEKFDIAFPYQQYWLYGSECQKESGDFIKHIWDLLPRTLRIKLEKKILAGDPNFKERRAAKDQNYKKISIYRRLKWIKKNTKESLSSNGEGKYKKYDEQFGGKEDPLEETAIRSGTQWVGNRYEKNENYSDFVKFSVSKHTDYLKENDDFKKKNPGRDNYYEGANNSEQLWKEWSQREPEAAVDKIAEITKEYFSFTAWNGISRGFSEQYLGKEEDKQPPRPREALEYLKYLQELNKLDNSQVKEFIYSASYTLQSCTQGDGLVKLDKDFFLALFNKISSVAKTEELDEHNDRLTQAINHSVGHVTEALVRFMWAKSEGKRGDISRSFAKYFDGLLMGESESILYAKIIMAEHLYNMHVFLPEWTEANIIPLFDWNKSNEPYEFWAAFMHNPNISKGLAESLKPCLLDCFTKERLEHFEKDSMRRNLIHMATIIMMGDQFSESEVDAFISPLDDRGKAEIVSFYERDIREAPDSERKKRWNEFKKVLLKLSKRHDFSGSRCTYYIIKLIMKLPLDFYQKDWPSLAKIIGHTKKDNLWMIYNDFAATDKENGNEYLCNEIWNEPELALEILSKITPDQIDRGVTTIRNLETILNKLSDEHANIVSNPDYIRLKELWVKFK